MYNRNTPVVVEQSFNQSVETVWNALTQINLMKKWYFDNIPDFKPIVGFKTQFNVTSTTRDFLHYWKITEVIPMKKISYEWTFDGINGVGLVTFELSQENNATLLRLTSEGLETFPEDIPEFTYESCLGGWNYFIKERLTEFLTVK